MDGIAAWDRGAGARVAGGAAVEGREITHSQSLELVASRWMW